MHKTDKERKKHILKRKGYRKFYKSKKYLFTIGLLYLITNTVNSCSFYSKITYPLRKWLCRYKDVPQLSFRLLSLVPA